MPKLIGAGVAGHIIACELCGGLQTLSFEDYQIHSGAHYFIGGYATLANGGTINFTVTTPNTVTWSHMTYVIETSGPAEINVYSDITGVSGGSVLTPVNSHGNNQIAATAQVKLNPTLTLGNKIDGYHSPPSGGKMTRLTKLILEQNTTYLWRIVSEADSNIINYRGQWYEHSKVTVQ